MGDLGGFGKREAGSEATISNKWKDFKKLPLVTISERLKNEDDFNYIKDNGIKLFGVTIKPCSTYNKLECAKEPQILGDLARSIQLASKYYIHDLKYEFTTEVKNGRYPHIHFTVLKKDTLFRYYLKGYSIWIVPMYSYKKWIDYCRKDEDKDDYSFID